MDHHIWALLLKRDTEGACNVVRESEGWEDIVCPYGKLQGHSVLHLVAGQNPGGYVPGWYYRFCEYICEKVCVRPLIGPGRGVLRVDSGSKSRRSAESVCGIGL